MVRKGRLLLKLSQTERTLLDQSPSD